MRIELLCPACGACNFDFDDYESVVLLAPNLALMQFTCPRCKIHLSATVKLTVEMQRHFQQKISATEPVTDAESAAEPQRYPAVTDATTLSYASSLIVDAYGFEYGIVRPLKTAAVELKEELEYFKNQLDTIDTVDQAIKEIDTNPYPKRRDF
ncbi:MAG TPA: hypothetical protein DEB24_06760 [Coriobacteriia bacterium]|nr:hypothetical protein [Coriobacteriia bacterium]